VAAGSRGDVHCGVQGCLPDLIGLSLGGLVHAVHAHAGKGVVHLQGELVERQEQVVDDAVSGGARPRVSMGVFGGSRGSNVGEGRVVRGMAISTRGGRVSAGGLLAFARAAERRRGLRQVGDGGGGGGVGVA
jgi:hypothetical protein